MSSIKEENAKYVDGDRTEAVQASTTHEISSQRKAPPPQAFEPFISLTGRVHKRRQPSCVHWTSIGAPQVGNFGIREFT